MNFKSFDELLHLDVVCELATMQNAALLIVGDCAKALAKHLYDAGKLMTAHAHTRLLFGLPILTAPFPLFVGALMTERNTSFNQLSLFGWIEDNYIEQPRAEVFGLTPFGEQPVLFLRDFDMDHPVEVWRQSQQPMDWLRIVGVAIATSRHTREPQLLMGDDAALIAMEHALPTDAQPFVASLRMDVTRGGSLRAALRQRRKMADAGLTSVCDGWRILSKAANFVRLNPSNTQDSHMEEALRLAPPKRW
jgi:hypothetical protein